MQGVLLVARAVLAQEVRELEALRLRLLFAAVVTALLIVACAGL